MGLVAPRHVGSSRTRARTRVPCIGRWILNHCATREAPATTFVKAQQPLVGLWTLSSCKMRIWTSPPKSQHCRGPHGLTSVFGTHKNNSDSGQEPSLCCVQRTVCKALGPVLRPGHAVSHLGSEVGSVTAPTRTLLPGSERQGWGLDRDGPVLDPALSASRLSYFLSTHSAAGCPTSPKPPFCSRLRWTPPGRMS